MRWLATLLLLIPAPQDAGFGAPSARVGDRTTISRTVKISTRTQAGMAFSNSSVVSYYKTTHEVLEAQKGVASAIRLKVENLHVEQNGAGKAAWTNKADTFDIRPGKTGLEIKICGDGKLTDEERGTLQHEHRFVGMAPAPAYLLNGIPAKADQIVFDWAAAKGKPDAELEGRLAALLFIFLEDPLRAKVEFIECSVKIKSIEAGTARLAVTGRALFGLPGFEDDPLGFIGDLDVSIAGCQPIRWSVAATGMGTGKDPKAGAWTGTADISIETTFLALGPELATVRKRAEEGEPASLLDLARRYVAGTEVAKDITKAVDCLAKAIDKGHAESAKFLGHLHEIGLVGAGAEGADYAKAAELYRKAGALGLKEAASYAGALESAVASYREGVKLGLASAFSEVVKQRPTLAAAWLSLAHANRGAGSWDDAVTAYTRYLTLVGYDSEEVLGLIRVRVQRGKSLQDALKDADKSLAMNPKNPRVLVERSTVYELFNIESDRADEDIQAALAIEPDHPEALMSRGRRRYLKGDLAGAIEDLQRVKEGIDTPSSAWLARAYAAMGDFEKARQALKRNLPPDFATSAEIDYASGETVKSLDVLSGHNPELAARLRGPVALRSIADRPYAVCAAVTATAVSLDHTTDGTIGLLALFKRLEVLEYEADLDEQIKRIAELAPSARKVTWKVGACGVAKEHLEELAGFASATDLAILGSPDDGTFTADLTALARMKLASLVVSDCYINGETLAGIEEMKTLRRLELPGLDGKGIDRVSRLEGLEALYMTTPIGKVDVAKRAVAMRGLKRLGVVCSAADKVFPILVSAPSLDRLRVNWPKGPPPQGALDCIVAATSLTSLDLGNEVDDATLARVATLPKLATLDLRAGDLTDAGVSKLKGVATLRTLVIRAGEKLTDEGLRGLPPLTRLELYSCTGVKGTAFASMTGLQELKLAGNTMTDAVLAGISGLTALRVLDIREPGITEKGCATLPLSLTKVRIDTDDMPCRRAVLKRLKYASVTFGDE